MYCALTIRTCVVVGEKEQRGTETLSSSAEEIAGDFADRLKRGSALAGKLLFDQDQVVADQVEDFLYGQKRDGRSSRRRVSGVVSARGQRGSRARADTEFFQPT